jgi:hypothetical protein
VLDDQRGDDVRLIVGETVGAARHHVHAGVSECLGERRAIDAAWKLGAGRGNRPASSDSRTANAGERLDRAGW